MLSGFRATAIVNQSRPAGRYGSRARHLGSHGSRQSGVVTRGCHRPARPGDLL